MQGIEFVRGHYSPSLTIRRKTLEVEAHISNAGFQHGVVMRSVDRLEIAHTLDARRKKRRVTSALNTCVYRKPYPR